MTLEWTPYHGTGFECYEVQRQAPGADWELRETVTDSATTAFVDSQLTGSLEYSYQIVVVTSSGDKAVSQERVGGFHELVDTWPLDIGADDVWVRLAAEGDLVVAQVSDPMRSRLLHFGRSGDLLAEQILFDRPDIGVGPLIALVPRVPAHALDSQGQRIFLTSELRGYTAKGVAVHRLDPAGRIVRFRQTLFADGLAAVTEWQQAVEGRIELYADPACRFSDVMLRADGTVLLEEDFAFLPTGVLPDGTYGGWTLSSHGIYGSEALRGWIKMVYSSLVRDDLPVFRDFRFEVEVVGPNSMTAPAYAAIQVGAEAGSRFILALQAQTRQAQLDWSYRAPAGSQQQPEQSTRLRDTMPFVSPVPYRVGMEAEQGEFSAWIETPVWSSLEQADANSASVVAFGEGLALTVNDRAYYIDREGGVKQRGELPGYAVEMRLFQPIGEPTTYLGLCVPTAH